MAESWRALLRARLIDEHSADGLVSPQCHPVPTGTHRSSDSGELTSGGEVAFASQLTSSVGPGHPCRTPMRTSDPKHTVVRLRCPPQWGSSPTTRPS